ncbi:hypothetical protein CCAL12920_00685 [Campylobacter sp. RM12920]|uniref:Phage minor tail protein L n=1 Tax=Campylobacter californiensis TaxID=1032243 RepID=A0ABD4JG91_9BACT|nr:hypothetical protein [Campylobacter sp. RM9328]MBE2985555.1 hypothetical protein [Campylobacter sp. RM12919]MBE2987416.1 hypothetical protein [Campylobacter sp. RM12920]
MKLTTIKDLNALTSDSALLVALDIFIPDTPTVRVVNNSENISFRGDEYVAFPFFIGEIQTAKGETPSFSLQIDNTSRAMERYVLKYDEYLKTNGADNSSIKAVIYVLNTKDLSEAVLEENFELTNFSSDEKYITFNLGASSLFNLSYPPRKMYKDFCTFAFKGEECGYKGDAVKCDKSLSDCRAKGNSVRFGGFLGIQGGYKK